MGFYPLWRLCWNVYNVYRIVANLTGFDMVICNCNVWNLQDFILGHDGCNWWLLLKVSLASMPTRIDPTTSVYLCYVFKEFCAKWCGWFIMWKVTWNMIWLVIFCGLIIYEWDGCMLIIVYLKHKLQTIRWSPYLDCIFDLWISLVNEEWYCL